MNRVTPTPEDPSPTLPIPPREIRAGQLGALALLLLLGFAATQASWWGLDHLRYLGLGGKVLAVGAAALAALITRPRVAAAWSRLAPIARDAVLAVVTGALAWTLRDRAHLLGDGTVVLDHAMNPLAYHEREPLGTAVSAAVSRMAEAVGLGYATAFELFSVLLGAVLVVLLARTDRAIGARGILLLLGFLHGALQLWFGYIEHYPPVVFVIVVTLLAARPVVTRRASLLPFLSFAALAVMMHISSVTLGPMVAWCVVRQFRLRRSARGIALATAEILGAILLAFAIWAAVWGRIDAPSLPQYLSILGQAGQFTYGGEAAAEAGAPGLWSWGHVSAFANEVALLSIVAWPLALGAAGFLARRAPRALRDDPWIAPLAITSLAYLVAQFQFFPNLGAPRDWDALAVGAFPVGLLAARLVAAAGWTSVRPVLAGLVTIHVAPWILMNADTEAAHERFAEMPMGRSQATYVLATRALKAGDVEEALGRFEALALELPYSIHIWHRLGMARDQSGDVPGALAAYEHSLVLQAADPRVSRTELLERIGYCHWRMGRMEEAAGSFAEALETDPATVNSRIFLAILAGETNDHARVWEIIEPVLPKREQNPAILILAAKALQGMGRNEEALPLMREAQRLFPEDPAFQAFGALPEASSISP